MDSIEPRYQQQLFFDPDKHPENTLKAFNEFTQAFELRYEAQFLTHLKYLWTLLFNVGNLHTQLMKIRIQNQTWPNMMKLGKMAI